jgi:UDP-N-acetylglucosamine 2-epimerase (non-hydrolysing)
MLSIPACIAVNICKFFSILIAPQQLKRLAKGTCIMRVLFIFGTRPEAIKLCPVIRWIRDHYPDIDSRVCVTGQHREMLDQMLDVFSIRPDYDLNLMTHGQSLAEITSRVFTTLDPILSGQSFQTTIVQGDTTTAMAAGMASFYRHIHVAHVEAGLRTGDLYHPFPEEMNRSVISRLAAIHFAPTECARDNLRSEGIRADRILVTGNTGIDALLHVSDSLEKGDIASSHQIQRDPNKKLVVVTAHRRENFGRGIENICQALAEVAKRTDIQIVYPVHRNPQVLDPVSRILGGISNIMLTEPLDYISFVDLMRKSHFIITDSGGIQEEAPSLGKPVLVLRSSTERPEAVNAGTVKLVGTDVDQIVRAASRLLEDSREYSIMSHIHNPYGDGHASERICLSIAGRVENLRQFSLPARADEEIVHPHIGPSVHTA